MTFEQALEPRVGLFGDIADELRWTFHARKGWLAGMGLNAASAVAYLIYEHDTSSLHSRTGITGIATGVAAWVLADTVNTDQLGSDEERTLASLEHGDTVARILALKNLALATILVPLAICISLATRVYADRWHDIPHTVMFDAFVVFLWLGIGNVASVMLPYRQIKLRDRWRQPGSWPRWIICLAVPYIVFYLGVAGYLHWPARQFCARVFGSERVHLLAWSFTYMCWGLLVWGAGLALASLYVQVAPERFHRALRRPT